MDIFLSNLSLSQLWILSMTAWFMLFLLAPRFGNGSKEFCWGRSLYVMIMISIIIPIQNALRLTLNKNEMIGSPNFFDSMQFMQENYLYMFGLIFLLMGILYKVADRSLIPLNGGQWYIIRLFLITLIGFCLFFSILFQVHITFSMLNLVK